MVDQHFIITLAIILQIGAIRSGLFGLHGGCFFSTEIIWPHIFTVLVLPKLTWFSRLLNPEPKAPSVYFPDIDILGCLVLV